MTLDLLCLVADRNIGAAIEGLLKHPERLDIGRFKYDLIHHPQHDPGCFHHGAEMLRDFPLKPAHALIVFDHDWSGVPCPTGEELEQEMDRRLARAGLGDGVKAVVIEPEIEAWVFSNSAHVPAALGWPNMVQMRDALDAQGLWPADCSKPPDPKKAMEWALEYNKRSRRSNIYHDLATKVSTKACTDRSFVRFRSLLQEWFPAN